MLAAERGQAVFQQFAFADVAVGADQANGAPRLVPDQPAAQPSSEPRHPGRASAPQRKTAPLDRDRRELRRSRRHGPQEELSRPPRQNAERHRLPSCPFARSSVPTSQPARFPGATPNSRRWSPRSLRPTVAARVASCGRFHSEGWRWPATIAAGVVSSRTKAPAPMPPRATWRQVRSRVGARGPARCFPARRR